MLEFEPGVFPKQERLQKAEKGVCLEMKMFFRIQVRYIGNILGEKESSESEERKLILLRGLILM